MSNTMSAFRNLRFQVPVRKLLALFPALWAVFAIPGAYAIGEDEYLQPEEAFQYTATAR